MRASSADGATGAMLAAVSAVPSAGQKPASFGNTRWHCGQLFISEPTRGPSVETSASFGGRGRYGGLGSHEVDDSMTGGALLEDWLAAEAMKELWRKRHVTGVARAVDGLGYRGAALRADHVVPAVQHRRQGLGRRISLGRLVVDLLLHVPELRVDVAFAGCEVVDELSMLSLGRLDLLVDAVDARRQLAYFLFAIAEELAELFEFALRGVRFALRPRAGQLLARMVQLLIHVADVLYELSTRLVHGGGCGAIRREPLVELRDAGLQPVEGRALLR